MKNKSIWLINIGEPLPVEGNKPHRMSNWKTLLENDGFNVKFLTTDFEHQRKKWIFTKPIDYILLKSYIGYSSNISIKRLFNHFFISISFLIFLFKNKNKPDLIIVSYPTMLLSFFSVIYGGFFKVKVIVDVRDKWPDIFEIKPIIKPFLFFHKIIKSLIFRFSSFIIAVSPGYLSWALTNKKLKGDVIPLSKPQVSMIERQVDESADINFIFSGSLGDTYNLDIIFQFSKHLLLKNINHNILICGDGPKMKTLITKQKKYPNVKLLGWLNNSDLQKQLDKSHFGLMFYNENSPQGWPNKLIEYISNGLPIINTLNGESSELIKKNKLGLNINNSSLNEISKIIEKLIESPNEYMKMSQNNYNLFSKGFSEKESYLNLKNIINNELSEI